MKQFKEQEYTVNICTDIIEWAKEFYGMPDNAELDNRSELESECMGFSQIDDKEIWVFIPKNASEEEIGETLAHEVGHIIVPEWTCNPEQIDGTEELHEQKAEFYENYYMSVRRMLAKTIQLVCDHQWKSRFSEKRGSWRLCAKCSKEE
jgi:hypothetical protein